MKHIIAVLLENEPGALSRVVALFSARGYNIESLTVAPTEDPSLSRMTIVVDTDELTPPCGVCRQIIWEFCGDVPVILSNLHGKTETVQMSELLPRAFDSKFLK